MEPLSHETAKIEYSIGKPEEAETKEKEAVRLYIVLNGEKLNIRGIKIITSERKANFINFFGKIWTKIKNKFPGKPVVVRRKYIPLAIGSDKNIKIVYVNYNSLMKHLLLYRGKSRERELNDFLSSKEGEDLKSSEKKIIDAIITGTSYLDRSSQGMFISDLMLRYAIRYYNDHRSADIRLAFIHKFWKKPVSPKIIFAAQLKIEDYDPLKNPVFDSEKHRRTEKYIALSFQRMQLSGTVAGDLGQEEQKIATHNWLAADHLIATWAMNKSKKGLEVSDILQLNRILGQDLRFNKHPPGVLRGPGDEIFGGGKNIYIGGKHVKTEMNKFIIWLKDQLSACDQNPGLHAVRTAAEAYHRLVSIHPFFDANGRTARMVMDYILERYGLPPAALISAKAGIFGELGDKQNIPLGQIISEVRQGIMISCEQLELASPF